MAELIAQLLQGLGHKVTIAYYATLTDEPDLSGPGWHLLSGKTRFGQSNVSMGFAGYLLAVTCRNYRIYTYYGNTTTLARSRARTHEIDTLLLVGRC